MSRGPSADRAGALEIARAAYRDLALYDPRREPCAIDLSDNTNLFGVPPAAARALRDADAAAVTRYPAVYARALKQAIADAEGVPPECVATGCGSDDVIDSAFRAFSEPGDAAAFPDPTFAMLPVFARMNGLEPRTARLLEDGDLDADSLVALDARVTYVCSPNNPTGRAFSAGALDRTLAGARGLVILDEAYVDYAGHAQASRAVAATTHPRLLVTRTLSKANGLAGLRVGYGIGSPAVVAEVEKSRGPYKVGGLAERAAIAALTEDRAWVRERVAEIVSLRERFARALAALGLRPLPSHANFVLVPVSDAAAAGARLRERGVAVRPFPGVQGVGDALRITIGPWEMLERLLDALPGCLS